MSLIGIIWLKRPTLGQSGPDRSAFSLGGVGYIYCLVVMLSQLFVYVQTHQVVHVKYVQFFVLKNQNKGENCWEKNPAKGHSQLCRSL